MSQVILGEEINLSRKRYTGQSWGSKGVLPMPENRPTSFDEIVERMGLSPAEYESSAELKQWVLANVGQKYVPVDLLIAWGFEVDPH